MLIYCSFLGIHDREFMHIPQSLLEHSIQINIQQALAEDIADGDITALLTPENEQASASILSRETMVLAGQPWVNALIQTYDSTVNIEWLKNDGERVAANEAFLKLSGSARSLLTVERAALNFIQTLSAVATKTAAYLNHLRSQQHIFEQYVNRVTFFEYLIVWYLGHLSG